MSFHLFFPILFLYFHAVQGSLLSLIHNGAKGNLLQYLFILSNTNANSFLF